MKELNTYTKGQKVKVDRGSSGNGVQFLTIKDKFKTDNCNGYDDYNFDELDERIHISEYYIRPISESDTKLKTLYDELNIGSFQFDYDDVQRKFWESQKENIKSVTNFINNFFHPYLTEYKHTLPISKITDWDSFYHKGMETKNHYYFTIKHKFLNIIILQGSSYITVYITAPTDYYGEMKKTNKKSVLGVFDIDVEYTDDEYTDKMKYLVEEIILQFEEGFKQGHYHIHPDYKKVDAVKRYKPFVVRGTYDDWQHPIPSNYTYALRNLNEVKYYVFNKGFE